MVEMHVTVEELVKTGQTENWGLTRAQSQGYNLWEQRCDLIWLFGREKRSVRKNCFETTAHEVSKAGVVAGKLEAMYRS